MTETFIKERKHNLTGKVEKVGIDDACIFMGHFANGSLANFESTRYARGHKAQYTFEINGEKASIYLGSARPASPELFRLQGRRPPPRLEVDPRLRQRSPVHQALVGARPAARLRAYLRPPGRRFHRRRCKPASPPGRRSAMRWRRSGFAMPC